MSGYGRKELELNSLFPCCSVIPERQMKKPDCSYQFSTSNVVQFSTFCNSLLLFQLIFGNILKDLIICPQYFHVLIISYRLFTAVPLVIENYAKFIPLCIRLYETHCYLRLKSRFLAHIFSKNSKFCCRANVGNFSWLIYPDLL